MINAIAEIGKYVTGKSVTKDVFLKNICKNIDPIKLIKGKELKQYIVIVNINTRSKQIDFEFEAINANNTNSALKYLFVGNASGNSPKIYATSNVFSNILQSLFYLKNNDAAIKSIFLKKKIKKEKGEYFVNPSITSYSDKNQKKINEIQRKLADENDEKQLKKLQGETLKILEKEIQNKLGLTSDEISLYTIKIDGQIVCQKKEYLDIIYNEKIEKLYKEKGDYKKYFKTDSICSICSDRAIPTTSNVTNLEFKFYMTDKLGFSSNFNGNFKSNYNICQRCYQYLMIAERYINENLRTKIGGINVYVLPKFIFPCNEFNINEFSRHIIYNTNQIKNIRTAEGTLKEESKKYNQYKSQYLINYLFYQKPQGSSEFNVLKLIKDIPPSRIEIIKRNEQEISRIIGDKFFSHDNIKIDLNHIWRCIPVKIEKDKKSGKETVHGYSKYLQVLDSIFSDQVLDYDFLINQAVKTFSIIKYETPKFSVKTDEDIVNKIICLNFLLLFVKKLNLLGGMKMETKGDPMIISDLIPNEIMEYWNTLEIYNDNQKKGTFLLGYLMGEIGSRQVSQQIKNKPILNKINFQGMGTEKLKRLTADVLEKLKQYQILSYNNENIFSASQILIERQMDTWSLSNQENVFYILSGFAYSNLLSRKRSKEKFILLFEEKSNLVKELKSTGMNVSEFEQNLEKARLLGEEHSYYKASKLLKEIKK